MKNNEILWEQTLDASLGWIFMGMEITFIGFIISMIVYNLIQMYKYGTRLDAEIFVELLEIGGYIAVYFYTKLNHLFVATTLSYQIKEHSLIYNWGVKKETSVAIPFSDVTAINLVEYHNSAYSTIYLVTKADYKLYKMNFDDNSPRHTYTLEKILNGPAVYQLMRQQWALAASKR